ncbi:MAG: DUF1178 family protein [Rhodobacteraceae bacterium]|nr:DUF1178 family protein [Paracoccaceae bacterium]
MIRYSLQCDNDHDYDSWFQSSEAFRQLKKAGMLSCPICGSSEVEKSMMAPQVAKRTKTGEKKGRIDLAKPLTRLEAAVHELRQEIEKNSEDVGRQFAREARAIAKGDAPHRPIRGESHLKEARALIEEGIGVLPLPWSDRVNTH